MDYQLFFNLIVSAFMGVMAYKVSKLERDVETLKTVSVALADLTGVLSKLEEEFNEEEINTERGKENG